MRLPASLFPALFLHFAWADQVTPNDRVTTKLIVRHDPEGSSAAVGTLNPGEAAKLEGTLPFWMVGNPEILDVKEVAASPKTFYKTVSDHLPLRGQFNAGPDDN